MIFSTLPPDSWSDPLVLPALLVFVGAVVWFLGFQTEGSGKKAQWKWIGAALILLALFAGAKAVWAMINPETGAFYRASLQGLGRKAVVAHWFALVLPIVALGGVAYMIWRDSRLREFNRRGY